MLLSVGHVTRYTYAAPVRYTIQAIRLTPLTFPGQRVIAWTINTLGIEKATAFRDAFGNKAHLVAVAEEHHESVVIAKGVVETEDKAGVVKGLVEPAPLRVYLRETPRTKADHTIRDLASQAKGSDRLETLHSLMGLVRDNVDYCVGATNEHTSAASALEDGKGVCQDHAHIFISAARTLGVPSRYVNGYFWSGSSEPSDAHHAWAEAWVEGIGWVGFDPANRQCPTESYIRLAAGLDSTYAAPIRGTRLGGAFEDLDVVVEVQQQNVQQ